MRPERFFSTIALIAASIVLAACGARDETTLTYPTPTVVPPQAQISQAEINAPEKFAQQEPIVAVPVQPNVPDDVVPQFDNTNNEVMQAVPVPSITPAAVADAGQAIPDGNYLMAQPLSSDALATATERAYLAANPPTPPPAPTYYLPPEFFLASMGSINRPVRNTVTLQFDTQTSAEQRQQAIASIGGTVEQEIDQLGVVVVSVPDENVQVQPPDSVVVRNEPDYYVTALADFNIPPSDTRYSEQWALASINAPMRWASIPDGASPIVVAVIDSGVCFNHPDLQGQLVPGWDYIEDDATPQDELGHGCAISSMIAARTDDGFGMAGVAPHAKVMPLRVLDKDGIGRYSDVASAIVYAVDNGAQVINISLGGIYDSTMLLDAISYATENNVTVVAAAGNSTSTELLYPAAYASVYAVGAVDSDGVRASFSNYGDAVDLWAPGIDVLGAAGDSEFYAFSGTSFAVPHAVGVAAVQIAAGQPMFSDSIIVAADEAEVVETPEPEPVAVDEALSPLFASSDAAIAQQSNRAVKRSRAVEIDMNQLPAEPFTESNAADRLLLNFFDNAQFIVAHTATSARPGGTPGYVWQGEVVGNAEAEVILIVDPDGNMVGHLNVDGVVFEINHNGNGLHTVQEVNPQFLLSGGQPDYTLVELQGDPVLPEAVAADAQTEIDVLVVYTAAARAAAGSAALLESQIDSNVVAANNSFYNGKLTFRFNLLDKVEIDYAETGSLPQARNAAANGEIPGLHELRDSYGADIVTLIVETGEPNLCGVAFLMGVPSITFDDFAYNVVRRSDSCMSGGLIYAHENGHTMGGSHDMANMGGFGSYNYSNGYQDPAGAFSTVMGYPINGTCEAGDCRWLMRWSSPEHTYYDVPLGTAEQSDMVRTLNENAYVVANFRARQRTETVKVQQTVNPPGAGSISVFYADSQTPTTETAFPMGTKLMVRAEANSGYEFNSWNFSGDYNGSDSFIEYPVVTTNDPDTPMLIVANFVPVGEGVTNDDPTNATLIANLPYADTLNTADATVSYRENPSEDNEYTSMFSCHTQVGHSVWYLYTGDGSRISVDTLGSDYDTTIAVFEGQPESDTEVACSFEDTAPVTVNTTAGQAYYIGVAGTRFGSGNLVVNVAVDEPLAVISTSPQASAANVPTDTNITLIFNRAVVGSLDSATLSCGTQAITFSIVQENAYTYRLDPATNLPTNSTCTVSLAASSLADNDGNALGGYTLTFATGDGSNNSPQVISTFPAQNAANVRVNSSLIVELSAPIVGRADSVTLGCQPGGESVSFDISQSGTTYALTPTDNLPFDSSCVLSIDTQSVTNGQGETLVDADGTDDGFYRLTFSTEKQPQIITTLPRDGAVGVSPDTNIILVMSELPLNLQPGVGVGLTCDGVGGVAGGYQYSISPEESLITLNPNNVLPRNVTCVLTIPTGIATDLDGYPLADTDGTKDGVYTMTFTVGESILPPQEAIRIEDASETPIIDSVTAAEVPNMVLNLGTTSWTAEGAWTQVETGWQVSGKASAPLSLTEAVDISTMQQPTLRFNSVLDETQATAAVEIQIGDERWITAAVMDSESVQSVDLSGYLGADVRVRFLWLSGAEGATWNVSNVTIQDSASPALQTDVVSPQQTAPIVEGEAEITIEEAVGSDD